MIEKKFLLKEKFDLDDLTPLQYERYIVFKNDEVEIRVQKKEKQGMPDGPQYEFERKFLNQEGKQDRKKFLITEAEFEYYKSLTDKKIIREGYFLVDGETQYSLKVYKDKFEGLIRVEIEFKNEEEANNFKPFDWLGADITDSPIGKDAALVEMSKEEYLIELATQMNKV